jgi:predicted DNA-binding transcriptional regulator AlpA
VAEVQGNATGRNYGGAEDAGEAAVEIRDQRSKRRPVSGDTFIAATPLCNRFGIVSMTLRRWLEDGRLDFPRPFFIGGRRYWRITEIDAWERARASASIRERKNVISIHRLRQEVVSAGSRAEAEALIADSVFDHLPADKREEALAELIDILGELPEST